MNTLSHIKVARLVYGYLEKNYNIKLNKTAFIYGNIAPDFGVDVVRKPHHIETYFDFIKSEVESLSRCAGEDLKTNYKYSKRLGVICHYCTDFFCFVHNKDFTGTPMNHVRYEMKLNKYCRHHYEIIKNLEYVPQYKMLYGADAISDNILALHKIFMSVKQGFETDWRTTLAACTQSMLYIIQTARGEEASLAC